VNIRDQHPFGRPFGRPFVKPFVKLRKFSGSSQDAA
jgi:hypothetical protein